MFYYIKDLVIGQISQIKIETDETIQEIETDIIFENPFFENGKIIEFIESETFKKQEIERIKKEDLENQEKQKEEDRTNNVLNSLEYKTNKIKQKYQDIIFAKYSLTDQLNMSNEAIYITSMVAFEKRDFTVEQIARLNEIKEAKIWIDEQRKLYKSEIDNII